MGFVKTLFAVAVCVMVFAACNKNAGGAKVNAPRGAGNGKATPGGAAAKTDPDKGSVDDPAKEKDAKKKAAMEVQAKDIKMLRSLFRDSDNVWKEFWKILAEPNTPRKENIFLMVYTILDENFNVQGHAYKKTDAKKAECSEGRKFGKTKIEHPNLLQYDIYYAKCDDAQNMKKIAVIDKKDINNWKVTFNPDAMDVAPEKAMGLFMLQFHSVEESGCKIGALPQARLGTLECENLGQDLNKTDYLWLKTLKFDYSNDNTPLEINYMKGEVKDNKNVETPGKAVDNLIKNEFVTELLKSGPPEFETDATIKSKAADAAKAKKEEEERKKKDPKSGVAADVPTGFHQDNADHPVEPRSTELGVQQQPAVQQDSNLGPGPSTVPAEGEAEPQDAEQQDPAQQT